MSSILHRNARVQATCLPQNQSMMSLGQCTLLPTKFANVINFTQERRCPSYLSTTESEDAMSLRQCTLLPTKSANVINFTQERRGPSYLSTTESEHDVSKTMYTATNQICQCLEFYTGTQGSKLPVYHRIRGCCVSKTMYTATDQICQCHKFEKQERRVQATCLPQNQRMLRL